MSDEVMRRMELELDSRRDEIRSLRAKVEALELTQCTSPWPDSPPCRGIQAQLDQLAAMAQELDRLKDAIGSAVQELQYTTMTEACHGHLDSD